MEFVYLLMGLLMLAALSLHLRWITPAGALAGVAVAVMVYAGGGLMALGLLGLFFLLGSLSTKWGRRQKAEMGLEQERQGQRSVPNVLANGGVPMLLGALAWWSGEAAPWASPMLAAALASATSDTLSSEMGNLYGRRFIDLRNFRAGQRGADGVISLEGTLIGGVGALLVGGLAGLQAGPAGLWWMVALAGLCGNLSDSLLGAFLQRRGWLNNHSVNFWSAATAAALAYLFYVLP